MEELSAKRLPRLSRAGLRDRRASTAISADRPCWTRSPRLNIGSRPASRSKKQGIEDLRAIPWVFSWAQCRLMLPGWYGFGTAVKAWLRGASGRRPGDPAGHARRLAVLPHHALQHGHGAVQERHGHRLALCRAGDRRRARQAHLRARAPGMAGLDRRGAARSRASGRCSRPIRCWRARSATAFPTSIR